LLREENQSLVQRIDFLEAANAQARKAYSREVLPEHQESRTNLAHGQYDSQIAVY
jgi:hypothetical protein